MQVQNTTARLIRLPGQARKDGMGNVVLLNGGLGRPLVPGDNHVPDSEWQEAKKNKAVRMFLATEPPMLRENGGKLPDEDLPTGQILDKAPLVNLLGISDRAMAKAQIADCSDRALLTQWAAADHREPLINAIDKRLKELG